MYVIATHRDEQLQKKNLQMMLPDPSHLHSKGRTVPFIVFQYILHIALQITEETHCQGHPKCQ